MATITKPTSPAYKSLKAIYRRNTSIAISPYNFTQQVYSWGGKLKVVEFELPVMTETQATAWLNFFNELNGFENVWVEDLTRAFPNESGSVSAVNMRLLQTDTNWDVSTAMRYGITFSAMEAK
jgi:hypothetical protein